MNESTVDIHIDRSLIQTEEEMLARWGHLDEPLVSIVCTAYNHEPFIADAIDGFLIQQTDFPFEILIHDDASKDRTAEIIEKYEKRYSNIIKPVYQKENQYSKGKKIFFSEIKRATGRYIAVCEGDDYWIDPLKLSKQVRFLEKNPEYVITGHDAVVVDVEGKIIKESKLPDFHKKDFDSDDLIKVRAWILTMSWVFRNVLLDMPPEMHLVKNGDTFMTSLLGWYGKSKYMSEIQPAVYRVHAGGVWSLIGAKEQLESQLYTYLMLYKYYKRIGKKEYASFFRNFFMIKSFQMMNLVFILKRFASRFFFLSAIKSRIGRIVRMLQNKFCHVEQNF